jgi:membrane-bound metal-dependent hydrolase YbcI (DUF457 family)
MNRRVHLLIGAGLFLLYWYGAVSPRGGSGGLFAAGILAAAFGSLLPDLLEPATNARHRGLFHSRRVLECAVLFFLAAAALTVLAPGTLLPLACSAFLLGYAAHLLADSLTRAGLPH